ncbi:M14 family metallopeptidase [Nibribacter koreensis]|uniref:Peptidase M14 domain-containing protein n=1 Tax=Nibribacter koreensis TaxID=1084519 RepID=A0ABP8F9F4_9BACT
MKKLRLLLVSAFVTAIIPLSGLGQTNSVQIAASVEGTAVNENAVFAWDKTQDYEAITEQCRKLVRAYPGLVEMESIGESARGKRIWVLTISNFNTDNVHLKPGFLVEGSTLHDPELGADHALYLAWYLLKNHATDVKISKLLEQKIIYIIPSSFPDAQSALRPSSFKSYTPSLDDDHDGKMDEDGPDDLTNDGVITLMRRTSRTGSFAQDSLNPLKLVVAPKTNATRYEWLGYEGFDNDRDGLVNEDPVGYQSTDLDWSWQWQPLYGATSASSAYPFSIPENRAIKEFINKRPNIAAVQLQYTQLEEDLLHLHAGPAANSLLAADSDKTEDGKWVDFILQSKKLNWLKHAKGLQTFPVQIFSSEKQALSDSLPGEASNKLSPKIVVYHAWTPFEHPTLGPLEIGGLQVSLKQVLEGTALERDLDRFAQTTIFNALQLPQLTIQNISCNILKDGLIEVTATVHNSGLMATHTPEDILHKIERADYVTLKDAVVLASSWQGNDQAKAGSANLTPHRIEVPNIPINSSIEIKWIVKPTSPTMLLEVDSRKGGVQQIRF